MWRFIKLLLSSWLSRLLLLLSIVSAIATYLPGIPLPAWVPLVVLIAAVWFASYDVYGQQQRQIETLQEERDRRRANLEVHPYPGSKYYVQVARENRERVLGLYIMLSMAVENKGARNSVINKYELELEETGKLYKGISPKPMTFILGRKAAHSLGQKTWLMSENLVRVAPESVLGPGILPFFVSDAVSAGCREIHCKLTLRDTEGNTVSVEFEIPEA